MYFENSVESKNHDSNNQKKLEVKVHHWFPVETIITRVITRFDKDLMLACTCSICRYYVPRATLTFNNVRQANRIWFLQLFKYYLSNVDGD